MRLFLHPKYLFQSLISLLIVFTSLYFLFSIEWTKSVLMSILMTVFNHISLPYVLKYGGKKLASKVVYEPIDGKLIFDSGSTYLKNWEGIGGKLFLTNRSLVFKSHNLNIQKFKKVFNLSKITEIRIPKDRQLNFEYLGKIEKFIVEDSEKWVKLLANPTKV